MQQVVFVWIYNRREIYTPQRVIFILPVLYYLWEGDDILPQANNLMIKINYMVNIMAMRKTQN